MVVVFLLPEWEYIVYKLYHCYVNTAAAVLIEGKISCSEVFQTSAKNDRICNLDDLGFFLMQNVSGCALLETGLYEINGTARLGPQQLTIKPMGLFRGKVRVGDRSTFLANILRRICCKH